MIRKLTTLLACIMFLCLAVPASAAGYIAPPTSLTSAQAIAAVRFSEGSVSFNNISAINESELITIFQRYPNLTLNLNTTVDSKALAQVRLTSANVKDYIGGAYLLVGSNKADVVNLFNRHFTNTVGTYTFPEVGSAYVACAKVNIEKPIFYVYKKSSNCYRKLGQREHYVDKNGFVHFIVASGFQSLIIADGGLNRK